jgi:hypothetical protein
MGHDGASSHQVANASGSMVETSNERRASSRATQALQSFQSTFAVIFYHPSFTEIDRGIEVKNGW